MLRWMATIQPGYRETWAAIACVPMAINLDWWSAAWGNRAFLEPFVDPVTTVGSHARVLIGISLGAKETGERGLATDVVRLALADGRMTASGVAEGLSAAAALDCDRPIRWALSLADIASHSAGHADAVAEVIARTLPVIADRPPAKLVPLLRLLDELLATTNSSVMADARPPLGHLAAASGQAGRLARSVLARGSILDPGRGWSAWLPVQAAMRRGSGRREPRDRRHPDTYPKTTTPAAIAARLSRSSIVANGTPRCAASCRYAAS